MQAQNINQQRILEINVISAEDLRIDGRSIKKNAIAYVRSDPSNVGSTKIDKEGGSFPVWDDKFDLKLPMHARNLVVQVLCDKKLIGSATIPTSDFIGDYTPSSYLHFLCYRLRDQRGVCNGIINLSVRVKELCSM
ncbi:BON1-associated protein 2-like [Beta vulgaris subsp. vulgaris]|uniref:BON1-associated protein 2-like n=1 Tax=Beta vulgaris subsp. vulgaris TaxID=3555 RepID=UPI00203678F0|nr:BON1-associated protein 2-like [Beta vulgaris subsp. vulgaris]